MIPHLATKSCFLPDVCLIVPTFFEPRGCIPREFHCGSHTSVLTTYQRSGFYQNRALHMHLYTLPRETAGRTPSVLVSSGSRISSCSPSGCCGLMRTFSIRPIGPGRGLFAPSAAA